MLPIKLKIEGDYWDMQIYRGRLYLWQTDGALLVLKWNELIQALFKSIDPYLITSAFIDGRYLYGSQVQPIVVDKDIQKVLQKRFIDIAKMELTVSYVDLEKFALGKQDNPFDDLQSDTEIFNSNIYACTSGGILLATAHKSGLTKPVSTRPRRIWDCRAIAVTANDFGRMTISAASEGLFEYVESMESRLSVVIDGKLVDKHLFQVSSEPSTFANWNYFSIYNTSLAGNSGLAKYSWHENNRENKTYTKILDAYLVESVLFGNHIENSISWGCDEKIYRATDGLVEIVDYSNPYDSEFNHFNEAKKIQIDPWKGRFLTAGSAPFGVVIEYENAIVIIRSDGKIETIKGEASRWRVYPRSRNYLNQLHIIKDDHIEIRSYNHDPFVNQDTKSIGKQYRERENFITSHSI